MSDKPTLVLEQFTPLDSPPQDIHESFPLQVLGELTQFFPIISESFCAILVLPVLDLAGMFVTAEQLLKRAQQNISENSRFTV